MKEALRTSEQGGLNFTPSPRRPTAPAGPTGCSRRPEPTYQPITRLPRAHPAAVAGAPMRGGAPMGPPPGGGRSGVGTLPPTHTTNPTMLRALTHTPPPTRPPHLAHAHNSIWLQDGRHSVRWLRHGNGGSSPGRGAVVEGVSRGGGMGRVERQRPVPPIAQKRLRPARGASRRRLKRGRL